MNFSRFRYGDIQSWWEVPGIAYFCSLFRTAFNLLDFDIEELEEALLTDGTEESASSLLTELIVRLLNGCLGNNDISAFNYQMYLRRLFRQKCQETGRYNPFNTDIDFQFLPLRTKVEILYALCDFRLDAEDVFDLFKNLEAESLRVEPLGWDDNYSAYWYFYGTRLYREDIIRKPKGKNKKKKLKESKKRSCFFGDVWLDEDEADRVWQVVCFTEEDWTHLTEKFSKATSKVEKELYRSLSQNFLPEIPRLFQEKERLQRKRLLELAPRRTSNRVLQKIKKEEDSKQNTDDSKEEEVKPKDMPHLARENRAKRRNLLRSKSASSDSSSSEEAKEEMPQKVSSRSKSSDKRSKNSSATHKGEPPPEPPVKPGRKTNNSLASVTGQILIPENDEPVNSTRKKLKTSQIFSQTEEDIQTDMYKVLEQITAHEDAWPFMDPVEEEYAPNYYAVIRRPMDLRKMEERLDSGHYTDFSMFKADFKLIVNNCRLYNGQDNEYTTMVDNLQAAFDRLTEKYMHRLSSSDEEIAVEYQLPTPSRKHKLRPDDESPDYHKRKKRKSHSEGDLKSNSSDLVPEEKIKKEKEDQELEPSSEKKSKESHKNKQGKLKKKRKGHHRHGKHSKNHKKTSHKAGHGESRSKHSKKQKHKEGKSKEGKKSKQKKKKSKHHDTDEAEDNVTKMLAASSPESSHRSRSASPLPSIHTPSPSPTELDPPSDQLTDPDFFKDKYDIIKEKRRHAAKDAFESLLDLKQKVVEKQKQNLSMPEKDKHQKLRETIEKLKAKNEKYTEGSFKDIYSPGSSGVDKTSESKKSKDAAKDSENEDAEEEKTKEKSGKTKASKKGHKKNAAKNESASEALEEAVKDISKWLEEPPKSSALSSPCDSPAQTTVSTEEQDSRHDDELSQGEKSVFKKEMRKRPSSREPKIVKRREIQRTIERLQPGKSKGNLLTNISNKTVEKAEEAVSLGVVNKVREIVKSDEGSPKLSLGSVLPTVEFTLGKDHNFVDSNAEEPNEEAQKEMAKEPEEEESVTRPEENTPIEKKAEETPISVPKKDVEVETEPATPPKPNQEKATPNLSAWFKAFGAPKNPTATVTNVKKKSDDTENEEKPVETTSLELKPSSPRNTVKYDSPTDPETPNPDGGDSPVPVNATPRQRRTSTGSSVSERSSFSQDLDSPRHQMSHTSPLLRSPASPRTDEFQKISYPIINGSVRAGFYQDTTSMKSSPEKSCSPREGPQSPYSAYPQHVYAGNNPAGASTPNYFVDHNKSPLPSYTHNPPPYYDSTKAAGVSKPPRAHEEYTNIAPESFQQSPYARPYPPVYSPYTQPPATYSPAQHSPQPPPSNTPPSVPPLTPDSKTAHFPVKKRMYNEPEQSVVSPTKTMEVKDSTPQSKTDYPKLAQTLHGMSTLSTPSVDDIALALSEKSEMAKLRENSAVAYAMNERLVDDRSNQKNHIETVQDLKKDLSSQDLNKPMSMINQDNIDMVNMGYMNPEMERRSSGEAHDSDFSVVRDVNKSMTNTQLKVYDVDAIALNLGMSNPPLQKVVGKASPMAAMLPPAAHSQDRGLAELSKHKGAPAQAHTHQYEHVAGFSMNDIELANKKLFAPSAAALEYAAWKMPNQMRKDMMPSDYSAYNAPAVDKLKNELSAADTINYNKSLQQYNMFNTPRSSAQRSQDLQQSLPAELRIPNPRSHIKNDHMAVTSMSEQEAAKSMDGVSKSQKCEKLIQNHPLVSSNPYKTPYSNSGLPLDTLRNLPNIPQMLERYSNDDRFLSSFGSSSSLYHEKQYQMAQMFNKSLASEMPASSSSSVHSQAGALAKDNGAYKVSPAAPPDKKAKRKRADTKPPSSAQQYGAPADVLSSVKSAMMPAGFNFGGNNMALGGGLYGDNGSFSANRLMAANYMVAAVAHQQRGESEKLAKPAHQAAAHGGAFPFMAGQARAAAPPYPFVGGEAAPLYSQYLQRHQEELLRHTGAQMLSLYPPPPGYPSLVPPAVRQPYDAGHRHWL